MWIDKNKDESWTITPMTKVEAELCHALYKAYQDWLDKHAEKLIGVRYTEEGRRQSNQTQSIQGR